jgi:hypothetical protein
VPLNECVEVLQVRKRLADKGAGRIEIKRNIPFAR